ncbi:hypothetical protein NP233_g7347 [Leucocoprinus birnbaumii]|uniref:Uncharacterized protein n=1 Tax=Leucocoprinus birnbaumii TaxID=56174 RepID=A0AAD5VPF2_9AGAR|nr:hypothetical protein NP233_g7347 [Leucocoprinus birnbaumii]
MNVLKNPSFFRPASRPSSPAPVPAVTMRPEINVTSEKAAKSLNKFALGNLRRSSPPASAPASPTPLVQDGSYLEMLSLKFSEAVSKALAQPSGPGFPNELVSGKRPIPQGRGHTLGSLISLELAACQHNSHLHRAILRSLHRPLSVLLTNLSAHLMPLLASPSFYSPPLPASQTWSPNATQAHALAIATFAQELLEAFDELNLGLDADIRGDGLKSIREGLVSIIHRVVSPLVSDLRAELFPIIEALENANGGQTKAVAGIKAATIYHPSIITLRAVMPTYAKALARYTSFPTSHGILASFLVAVVWKGLVALSNRPYASSAPQYPDVMNKKVRTPPPYNTPPVTPPLGRFSLKLPPSRPPSPPIAAIPARASADAQALFDLFNTLPRPSADKEATRLAREAVDEAFDALKALSALLDAIDKRNNDAGAPIAMAKEVHELAEDIPLLIALPILLSAYGGLNPGSVATLLCTSEAEYRKNCLSGIGRAEECAPVVAQRVMDALQMQAEHRIIETLPMPYETNSIIYEWLRLETSTN